jgi:site-specific DNA-cytosine methylase
MEVAVRKYEVDCNALSECLRRHKESLKLSNKHIAENLSPTLTCTHGGEPVICMATQQGGAEIRTDDKAPTLTAAAGMSGNNQPVICLQGNQVDRADTSVCNGSGWKEDTSYTLNTMDRHAVCYKKPHYIVRRLTPLECERLQGFPDGWTDIGEYIDSKGKKKKTSDSARYKALGNSIALPPWKWVIKRISAQYERDATLASLFDGIGGFPLLWEQINGKGSCLWASEIEDFPIAVTKVRIE